MKEKILLFSRDPGGANTIVPLLGPLTEKGYEVRIFGKDVALDTYRRAGLAGLDIMDFISDVSPGAIERFLNDEKPALIITGTSADDFTEKYIWKAAEKAGIPSFAIFDQWLNYGVRFSPYGVSELGEYNRYRTHAYLPTKILVSDETARQDAIRDGLDEDRIIITGQPHFETLLKKASAVSPADVKRARAILGALPADFIITFASEPISDTYHETDSSEHYWGYTERTIFRCLLEALWGIADNLEGRVIIVLRPHPKESRNNYDDILSQFLHDRIKLIRDGETDSIRLIMASDLVCGMSSMFLIESVILGMPVISVQVGLRRGDPFVLARLGVLRSIVDLWQLKDVIKSAVLDRALPQSRFEIIDNPIENVINLVETYLCRN